MLPEATDRKRLRVGIVGCGKIADGHAEVLRYMAGVELAAVCDREPILAEQLAVRFGVGAWYTDTAEMLAKAQLDVVHITTPPGAHLALTEQCAAAGAHVFLEKPLALTSADAEKLIASVEKAGLMLSIDYWPNFDPVALEMKRMLTDGVVGEVVHVEAFIGYDLAGEYGRALMNDPRHWVHGLPGKLFQNMLDHICNRMTPFFTEEPEVRAMAYKRRLGERGDSTDALLDELRFVAKSGRVSAYGTLCSHARPVANTMKIYGTAATLEVDFNNRTVVATTTQKYPSSLGRLFPAFVMARRYWAQAWKNVGRFRRKEFQFFVGMETLLTRFYDAIRNGGEPPIAYREILMAARMMDSVYAQVYPVKTPAGDAAQ
ncbi:MAG: Gfo/Idh/MocA family oxidoreductase [Acidobacteriota bacterium]